MKVRFGGDLCGVASGLCPLASPPNGDWIAPGLVGCIQTRDETPPTSPGRRQDYIPQRYGVVLAELHEADQIIARPTAREPLPPRLPRAGGQCGHRVAKHD